MILFTVDVIKWISDVTECKRNIYLGVLEGRLFDHDFDQNNYDKEY
jgi:hypothetical protein